MLPAMDRLDIYLRTIDPDMRKAWANWFGDTDVTVEGGDILQDPPTDAVVSPGNSFGVMSGGLDETIRDYFGRELQKRLRSAIRDEYPRTHELPIGQALTVRTDGEHWPYLICAPTMRVPETVAETTVAYQAMRATLFEARDHSPIESVAIPAFGAGVGKMPVNRCAYQMREAYRVVRNDEKPEGLEEPRERHHRLKAGPPDNKDALADKDLDDFSVT